MQNMWYKKSLVFGMFLMLVFAVFVIVQTNVSAEGSGGAGNTLIADFGTGLVTEIDNSGNIIWQIGLGATRDAERLTNGNTLITGFHFGLGINYVTEVNNLGDVIWQKTGLGGPVDAERLANGNTLITEINAGRIIEVDNSGNIIWQKTGLNRPYDAERLANGNTLITVSSSGQVIEVDNAGNIVWQKTGLNRPYDAERLADGNTLITEYYGQQVIEVDSSGGIVWQKTGLARPSDAERLANGNTLIAEYGTYSAGRRIIEVNSAGNIVWQMTGVSRPFDVERLEPMNQPPVADAGGPYETDEGEEITFDASGSSDPDDDPLTYAWDLDDDGDHDDATGQTVPYTWNDDYAGTVSVEVSDGEYISTASASVTVLNVAPTVNIDGVVQPYSEFILPDDELIFTGSFTDPGTDDTHTIEWDFDDGNIVTGTLTPIHAYDESGLYTVTLTVTDDDGGMGTASIVIIVDSPAEATDDVIEDVEEMDLPNGIETALTSTLDAAINSLDNGNTIAAINQISAFINQVEAQRGKKLTDEQADYLINAAQQIIDAINNL